MIANPASEMQAFYIRLTDDGQFIRRWDRKPFEGATEFFNAALSTPPATSPAIPEGKSGDGVEAGREALAIEISRVAGCQVGSDRTNRLVDFILARDAALSQALPAPGEVEARQYSHEDRVTALAITLSAIAAEAQEEHGEWTWREIATAAMNILWCKPGQSLATVAAGNDEGVARLRAVAKLAGEHGVRYRTNTALEKFLAAIRFLSQGGGK